MMAVKQLPEEVEKALSDESQLFISHISPLAFYRTWTGSKIPDNFRSLLERSDLAKPVAVSVLVATIGPHPDEMISKMLLAGETIKTQIWTALAEDAVELALNFIFKLLCEDAEKDDCDIPDLVMAGDEPILGEALELVGAGQENVRLENSHLIPRFTRVALAAWVPVSKKKAPALAAKKTN